MLWLLCTAWCHEVCCIYVIPGQIFPQWQVVCLTEALIYFQSSWKIHFFVISTAHVLIFSQQLRRRNTARRGHREAHRRSVHPHHFRHSSSVGSRLKCGFVGYRRKTGQNPHDYGDQQLQSSATGGWLCVLWPYRGVRGVKIGYFPLPSRTHICLRLPVTESSSRNIKAKYHLHVSLYHTDKNKERQSEMRRHLCLFNGESSREKRGWVIRLLLYLETIGGCNEENAVICQNKTSFSFRYIYKKNTVM